MATKLHVTLHGIHGSTRRLVFSNQFRIGRDESCELRFDHLGVSARHAVVFQLDGEWFVRDLNSTNGTTLNHRRVQYEKLGSSGRLGFATDGPTIAYECRSDVSDDFRKESVDEGAHVHEAHAPSSVHENLSNTCIESYEERDPIAQPPRDSFERGEHKTRNYRTMLGLAAVLLLVSSVYVSYQYKGGERASGVAAGEHPDVKKTEQLVVQHAERVEPSNDPALLRAVNEKRLDLRSKRDRYLDLVDSSGARRQPVTHEETLVLATLRELGESEVEVPVDFVAALKTYIGLWQADDRFANAMARLHRSGLRTFILEALNAHSLPMAFLYVALQESNFKADAIGPETRHGIAKGMWQFLPGTAKDFGLKVGTLTHERVFDSADERFDPRRSTQAAAKYLRHIYTTDARASGLLVMAGYNWGHNNIKRSVGELPDDSRKHGFWKLLQHEKIPKETYDYVMSIVAAAVIARDPRYFGFAFKSPTSRQSADSR